MYYVLLWYYLAQFFHDDFSEPNRISLQKEGEGEGESSLIKDEPEIEFLISIFSRGFWA
jgi:hypothetical protein